MVETERPNRAAVVLSCSEYLDNLAEEVGITKLPQDETLIENFLVEDVLVLQIGEDFLLAA